MKIGFIFSSGRKRRSSLSVHTETPSEFFYGAFDLRAQGDDVDILEVPPASGYSKSATLLNLLARRNALPWRVSGELLIALHRTDIQWNEYDVVVATHSGIGFALELLRLFGKRLPPVVCIQCGLLNTHCKPWVRLQQKHLLKRMQSVLFADNEREGLLAWDKDLSDRIHVCPFGVDTEFWHPATNMREDYILSVGNDAGRDFETLCEAAHQIDCPIRILTQKTLPESRPDTVSHISGSWHQGGVTDLELRELYQHAACVVVPLHEGIQPSGQSVCLQAMACARPVVMTRTSGFFDPIHLKDRVNIRLSPPGRSGCLATIVNEVLQSPDEATTLGHNGYAYVLSYGRSQIFAQGIRKALELALSSSPSY